MENLQEAIDKKNKTTKKTAALEARNEKKERIYSKIQAISDKIVGKVEEVSTKIDKAKKEKAEKKAFQQSSKEQYDAYIELCEQYKGNDGVFTQDEEGYKKVIIKTENGLLIRTDHNYKNHPKTLSLTSYEGFTPVKKDGVEQLMYVKFTAEDRDTYDYGPHDDFTHWRTMYVDGVVRDVSGKFLRVIGDDNDRILSHRKNSDVSKEFAMAVYKSMEKTFEAEASHKMGDE